MILKRLPRVLLIGAMTIGLLAAPLATFAATPNWSLTGTALLPPTVKVDGVAGFSATVSNPGPSNIAQLSATAWFQQPYVDADASTPVTPPADYAQVPVYAALLLDGTPVPGACPTPWGAPVVCSLSALPANSSATLIVAYQTSGTAPAGIHAWFTSTGSGQTSGFCTSSDASHGDCLPANVGGTSFSTSNDFGGGFVTTTSAVSTSGIGVGGGGQSTTIYPPIPNIVVTAADGSQASPPPAGACAGCWGDFSQLNVDFGHANGAFKVVIEVDKSQVPAGVNQNNMKVVHINDAGQLCTLNVDCLAGESATVSKIQGGNYRITVILLTNGWVGHI